MTAYLSALAVCAASVAVGAALCCRERDWSWTAPAVGLAAIVLLALVAVRLPGHGTTAAAAILLASAASVVVAARRRVALRPLIEGLPVVAIVLALCSLPFLANGRIGELGAYILDDLSFHMGQADALRTLGSAAHVTSADYPNGPHALVAALRRLRHRTVRPVHGAAHGRAGAHRPDRALRVRPRATGTCASRRPRSAGVPYLAASYFAEGAFKEPLLALFVLGFVLTLREWLHSRSDTRGRRRRWCSRPAVAWRCSASPRWPGRRRCWHGSRSWSWRAGGRGSGCARGIRAAPWWSRRRSPRSRSRSPWPSARAPSSTPAPAAI